MRVLFVVPPLGYGDGPGPVDRVYGCNYAYDYKPPIHMLTVATVVQDLGHEVRFLDCPAEGIDADAFERIAAEPWDVAFFYTVYISMGEDLRAARILRQKHRQAERSRVPALVFLCTGAAWRPEQFNLGLETYIVLGEPEQTVVALLGTLDGTAPQDLAAIDGLGFFVEQTFHRGHARALLDVNTLPIPNRHLLRGTYALNRLEARPITVAYTARGCGYRCTFCTPNAVDQGIELEYKRTQPRYIKRPPLRTRRPALVIEEFRQIKEMGYQAVEICDNLFIFERERTLEILEGIKGLGLEWLCLSRAPMLHDYDLVKAMGEAGCKMIYIGSESFSQQILDDMHKDLKVADIHKAVETCRRAGVMPEVSVMLGGSPLETRETIRQSMAEAERLGTDFVHFSIALPSPSTELYDIAMEGGWFVDGDFRPIDNAKEAIVNLPHLTAAELKQELKRAYRRQYLSARGVLKQVTRVRRPGQVVEKMRTAGKLANYLLKG